MFETSNDEIKNTLARLQDEINLSPETGKRVKSLHVDYSFGRARVRVIQEVTLVVENVNDEVVAVPEWKKR